VVLILEWLSQYLWDALCIYHISYEYAATWRNDAYLLYITDKMTENRLSDVAGVTAKRTEKESWEGTIKHYKRFLFIFFIMETMSGILNKNVALNIQGLFVCFFFFLLVFCYLWQHCLVNDGHKKRLISYHVWVLDPRLRVEHAFTVCCSF